MNITDIAIVIGICLYMLLGFRDGFFKKIFGILGFWGGFIFAILYMDSVSEVIESWFDFSTEVSLVLAFFVILLFVVVIVNLLYRWFGASASENIQIRSRIAGALLGAGQGLVGISLVLVMLSIFDVPSEDDKKGSALYKNTIKIAPLVFDYSTQWIPESRQFVDVLRLKIERFSVPR